MRTDGTIRARNGTMNQSTRRALQILEYLARTGPASLNSMARDLGLNKSTAHRFVNALIQEGYAQQDSVTRAYGPTMRLVELATEILQRLDIRTTVRPVLEDTAGTTSETVHLAILENDEIVYIDKVEGRQAMQMGSRVGRRGTCHSTALGKVLLASRPPHEWEDYINTRGLVARTPNTIVDPGRLRNELERVRERGHAIDNVENEEGIRCVAAPIRDHTGSVVAAISISGWTVSMTMRRVQDLVPIIVARSAEASRLLGSPRAASGEDRLTPRRARSAARDAGSL
jgi:IclR family acetate operon transcriptional repressor